MNCNVLQLFEKCTSLGYKDTYLCTVHEKKDFFLTSSNQLVSKGNV